jgi:hypothetical protein
MAEVERLIIDGTELPGLTNLQEVELTKGELEVPEQGKTRRISDGNVTIPAIQATYKTARDTETQQFLKSWFDNNEVHDVVRIRADAHGNEFDRELWPACELTRYLTPAYDASSPDYAQLQVTMIPWDITHVEAG